MTRLKPFYVDDLNIEEVVAEVAKDFGLVILGVAVGMRLMGRILMTRLCFTTRTFRGPSLFTGEGCSGAQDILTQQVIQWLGVGVLLLVLGIVLMIRNRDDHE